MSTFATPSPSKISRYSRYGSWQVLAEAQFQRGLVTDTAPVALPAGAVADARDYLFDRPGKMRKRGGSVYAGPTLGDATGTAHISFVPFSSVQKLIAVTNNAVGAFHAWDAGAGGAVDIGPLGSYTTQPPVFYDDKLYIMFGGSFSAGRAAFITCTAGVCSAADSVAPVAYYATAHAGYLIVANDGGAHKNRLWFSPIPNPESTWDTSNAYIDTNGPITGLASVQGVLIVFHDGTTERILGSIPPGTVGENMSLQPLSGQAGAFDAASIRLIGGNCYFADNNGVWVTNGASVTSLTSRADGTGIAGLWRTTVASAHAAVSMGIRSGTFANDYYMVSVLRNDGGPWLTALFLVYHVATGTWSRFQVEAISDFAASTSTLDTYAAPTHQGRVLTVSDWFAEQPANSADAAGTAIQPSVTSRVMGTGPFEKAFGDGHLTYDMRTASGATLALTYSRDIEQQTFQSSATFAGVTVPTRQRFPVSGDGHGFSWTVAQTGASSKTELYAVELEHRNYEEQADG